MHVVFRMGWQDLLVDALRWAPEPAAAATTLGPALLPAEPARAASLLLAGLDGSFANSSAAALVELSAMGSAAAGRSACGSLLHATQGLLAAAQQQQRNQMPADEQLHPLCRATQLVAACLAPGDAASASEATNAAADAAPSAAAAAPAGLNSAAGLHTVLTAACSALGELLTAWPHLLAAPQASAVGTPDAPRNSDATASSIALLAQLQHIAWQLQQAVPPLAQRLASEAAEAEEETRQRFQVVYGGPCICIFLPHTCHSFLIQDGSSHVLDARSV